MKLHTGRRLAPALFAIAASALTSSTATAQTVNTIGASQDAWVGGWARDENYGSSTILPMYGGEPGSRAWSYVQFDLLPFAGKTILGDAVFRVYLLFLNPPASAELIYFYQPNASWNAATLTWNNRPDDGAGIGVTGQPIGPDTNVFYDFVLPGSLVQGWIDSPATNFGIRTLN
jgi:hypothetical protein